MLILFLSGAVDEYLSSEVPLFLELRVRYLQACERMQEAMALSKSCLENHQAGKHLYFHQAYLTCLYKASLHESLHKEVSDGAVAPQTQMMEVNGTDNVKICKRNLTKQLFISVKYGRIRWEKSFPL